MGCQCPPCWGAIYPPPCDIHNPPGPRSLRERLDAARGDSLYAAFRARLAKRIEEDDNILRRL